MPTNPQLAALREAGWSVAVHNDYRLNGEASTFWLFTHPSGRWVKGEGATDEEAIAEAFATHAVDQALDALAAAPSPSSGLDEMLGKIAANNIHDEIENGD